MTLTPRNYSLFLTQNVIDHIEYTGDKTINVKEIHNAQSQQPTSSLAGDSMTMLVNQELVNELINSQMFKPSINGDCYVFFPVDRFSFYVGVDVSIVLTSIQRPSQSVFEQCASIAKRHSNLIDARLVVATDGACSAFMCKVVESVNVSCKCIGTRRSFLGACMNCCGKGYTLSEARQKVADLNNQVQWTHTELRRLLKIKPADSTAVISESDNALSYSHISKCST